MSYILDAIRKSDTERRRGQVPGVLDRHTAVAQVTAPPTSSGWLRPLVTIAAGGTVIGIVALTAVSFWPRPSGEAGGTSAQQSPEVSRASAAATPPPSSGMATSGMAATMAQTAGSAPSAPAAVSAGQTPPMVVVPPGTGWALLPMVQAGAPGSASAPMVMAPSAADWGGGTAANVDLTDEEIAALLDSHGAPRAGRSIAATPTKAAETRADRPAQRPASATQRDGEQAWIDDARADLKAMAAAEKKRGKAFEAAPPTVLANAPSLAAEPRPAAPAPSSLQARPTAAPPIDELSPSVRDALPAIALSVHIYTDSPSSRRVRVNNVLVHEGDNVAADLDVAAITREGVIFRFKGTEFFLPANDSWQPRSAASR